jgi:hypothetical protein
MKKFSLIFLLVLFCGSVRADILIIEVPANIIYDTAVNTLQYNYTDYQIRQYFKQDLRSITLDANIILSTDKERQLIVMNVETQNVSTIKSMVSNYGYKIIATEDILSKQKKYNNLKTIHKEVTHKTIAQRRLIYSDSLRMTK